MADLVPPLVDFVPSLTWFTLQEGTGNLLKTLTTITQPGATTLPGSPSTYNDIYVNAPGLVTITFPLISQLFEGQEFLVKDISGLGSLYPITVMPGDTYNLDGMAMWTVNTNYGYTSFIWSGTNFSVRI
jgi:hypothetical protein